jgi:hypothetical protein
MLAAGVLLAALVCRGLADGGAEGDPETEEIIEGVVPWKSIGGIGTTYQILQTGKKPGGVVKPGDKVTVHATGIVAETQKKFWSTKDKGQQPFQYTAGGGVITGWDKGAMGMRVNEVRKLRIPAAEGYGENGFPAWGIPPKAELEFELEVLSIKRKGGGKKTDDLRL